MVSASYPGRRAPALFTSLLLVACSGDDGKPRRDEDLDAGAIDSGQNSSDGGLTDEDAQTGQPEDDAQIPRADAGDPDAGPGREGISFTLLQDERPVPGAVVLFHNENGVLLETLATDANGRVHSDLVPYLLTALPPANDLALFQGALSYVELEDGDDLVATLPAALDEPPLRSFTLNAPAFAQAKRYYAYAGNADCNTPYFYPGAPSFPIDLFTRCFAETLDLVVVAIAENGPVAYLIAADQPVPTDGSTVAVQGSWQPASTFSVGAVDMPHEPMIDVAFSHAERRVGSGQAVGPDQDNIWRASYPGAFATEFDVLAGFEIPGVNENIYGKLQRRVTSSDPLMFDGDDALTPLRVTDLDDALTTRPTITLQASTDATDLDALFLELRLIDQGDNARPNYFWTILLSPGSASLTLPDTRQIADYFLGGFGASKRAEIATYSTAVYEGDHAGGYRAARQGPLRFSLDLERTLEPARALPSVWRRTDWAPPGI